MSTFILYACPQGPLADQIKRFLDQSREQLGRNSAHNYMPHCTLTGFFRDDPSVVPEDRLRLSHLLDHFLQSNPAPSIRVKAMRCRARWLGLELESRWIRQFALDFANAANSGKRRTPVRPKSWLHLSLAYEFPTAKHRPLVELARESVDPAAAVNWQLRYYQRDPDGSWLCHQTWDLP